LAECFLPAYRWHVANRRIEIVAAEIKCQVRVDHAERGSLAHHEFLHRDVLARGFAAIPSEKVFPRFGVKVDAVDAEILCFGEPSPHCFAIAVERLKEVSKPDADHGDAT
jgi:hypothetical protein